MKKSNLAVTFALTACLACGVALTGCGALSTSTKSSTQQSTTTTTIEKTNTNNTGGSSGTSNTTQSATETTTKSNTGNTNSSANTNSSSNASNSSSSANTNNATDSTAADTSSTDVQPVDKGITDAITVNTKYGTLEVTVDDFVTDEATTADYRATPMFGDNNTPGILELTVKNVSYNNPNEETADTVDLTQAVQLYVNGKTPDLLKSGLSYKGYESAYEGKIKCFSQGSTVKCNLAYELTDVPGQVTVKVGGEQYTMTVTAQ